VVEAIVHGDVNRDGLRWPVKTFDVSSTPGWRTFQLPHQPIDGIEQVTADGLPLDPDQFTYDSILGWVSIGVPAAESVTVQYIYSLKPDMAITNWDDTVGNYLFYNQNAAGRFGDTDNDGTTDLTDYAGFPACVSGPGTVATAACASAFDADLDADVDLADFARLQQVLGP
jgi:hypothetical protein